MDTKRGHPGAPGGCAILATQMELPNRFHIGTPKAGSTYLYDLLRSHPQVSLSSHQKLNFYSKRFERGADWYLSSFVGEGVRVDASPKIFMQGKVAAQRIQAWVEEPRFLLILRNPIDYVHSHYQMQLRGGYFKRSPNYARVPNRLVEFVELYPDYLERGLYHRTLSTEWLSRFELSRFKIVLFEDLVSRTESDPEGNLRVLRHRRRAASNRQQQQEHHAALPVHLHPAEASGAAPATEIRREAECARQLCSPNAPGSKGAGIELRRTPLPAGAVLRRRRGARRAPGTLARGVERLRGRRSRPSNLIKSGESHGPSAADFRELDGENARERAWGSSPKRLLPDPP